MKVRKPGEYRWHNRKVTLMFFLAKLFGKTYIGDNFYQHKHCRIKMKYFCGKYYAMYVEWI